MKGLKRYAAAVIIAALILPTGAKAAYYEGVGDVSLSTQNVFINGEQADITAYLINDNNYFKLRDLGRVLDIAADWDADNWAVRIDTAKPYMPEQESAPSPAGEPNDVSVSTQKVYVNGELADIAAYIINGNNYFKLRDLGAALDIAIDWDANTRSVHIDTSKPYTPETPELPDAELPVIITATGSGRLSSAPIKERWLSDGSMSREDFSQAANPAIFDDLYTREAYNAIRQTMLDTDIILPGNNNKGFNPNYDYAQIVDGNESFLVGMLGRISGFDVYETCGDTNTKDIYKFKHYALIKVYHGVTHSKKVDLTASVISEASALISDRERIILFNNYICEIMEYSTVGREPVSKVFAATKENPAKGACTEYADAFRFLCDIVGIPNITIRGENHMWNAVYIEGKWLYVDVSSNDVAGTNPILLTESYPYKAEGDPREAAFAKELVVPGSTK